MNNKLEKRRKKKNNRDRSNKKKFKQKDQWIEYQLIYSTQQKGKKKV